MATLVAVFYMILSDYCLLMKCIKYKERRTENSWCWFWSCLSMWYIFKGEPGLLKKTIGSSGNYFGNQVGMSRKFTNKPLFIWSKMDGVPSEHLLATVAFFWVSSKWKKYWWTSLLSKFCSRHRNLIQLW